MSKLVQEHFNTGLKLQRGWSFGKYELGEDINSKTQIVVIKGDTRIQMNEIELDGEYRINVDRNTSKQYDVIRIKVESYDLAILNIHSLMRMLK